MRLSSSALLPLRIAAVVAVAGCSSSAECVALPCALPLALTISVSAAAGGAVSNATFKVQGRMSGEGPCAGTPTACVIPGYAGTYTVTLSAPGFQSTTRTVSVTGAEPAKCNCGSANTEHLDVVLVAN